MRHVCFCKVSKIEEEKKRNKKQLDNVEKVWVIFMNLSKTFDLISHSLLLAKLKLYGFSDQDFLMM